MSAPQLLDPFEREITLAEEPRVLSFSSRGFKIPLEELLRHLAFDLVSAIPRSLGHVQEEIPADDEVFTFRSEFFQVGPSVLAVGTEIEQPRASHRVLELLGVKEDIRVRLNLTRFPEAVLTAKDLPVAMRESVEEGRSLGQVRIWGNEPGLVAEVRRTLARQMHHAGIESRVLDRSVEEPLYHPPAGYRLHLDGLPSSDLQVADMLLELLSRMPVEGAQRRAPRQISTHKSRVRRKGAIVSYRYETHRSGTGVLHMRRREVEAGVERPGLVRTFIVAGIRGAARLRIRDVGGRTNAEFAGTEEAVDVLGAYLTQAMGGRG